MITVIYWKELVRYVELYKSMEYVPKLITHYSQIRYFFDYVTP
jgi:hypothetical protein